jgi:hypothetical protein
MMKAWRTRQRATPRDAPGHARRKVGQAIEDIGNAIKK